MRQRQNPPAIKQVGFARMQLLVQCDHDWVALTLLAWLLPLDRHPLLAESQTT
uniref:Uncharacterized protein n=1 Tax=Globisporangium ultimum (strain ATCC 200006 / CBS 805.95 / DAOM BR144) TaxID=431595 RepID=K3X0S1_GLOUD